MCPHLLLPPFTAATETLETNLEVLFVHKKTKLDRFYPTNLYLIS